MDVAVLGSGALGSVFAGHLSAAGHPVHCVDVWEEHVDAICDDGLTVVDVDGVAVTTRPSATVDAEGIGEVDAAFVFVKSYHTEAILPVVAAVTGPETLVVTVQNGLGNFERIRKRVGASQAVGGTTTVGAAVVEPGVVERTSAGHTILGGVNADRVVSLASTLVKAGLPAESVDDPLPYIWRKQFVNTGIKPVAALTGLASGPLRESPDAAGVMERLIEEAIAVAKAKGVEVLSEDPVQDAFDVCEANASKRSSMLEDVRNERRTEIDYINGMVVRYGREEGVPTPHNEVVTRLVKAREASYLEAND